MLGIQYKYISMVTEFFKYNVIMLIIINIKNFIAMVILLTLRLLWHFCFGNSMNLGIALLELLSYTTCTKWEHVMQAI